MPKNVSDSVVCRHCGSVDDFSTEMKSNQKVATCNSCGRFIKNIPYNLPTFYYGKYRGKLISEVTDLDYLKWTLANVRTTGHMKGALESRILQLEKNG